jgi:hypothetical protein
VSSILRISFTTEYPTINNDPLVVPLCNETDLFISQSLKEKIWGLQYINLALLLHQNTAPLIKIIYDIKSVANIGCLCNATFAKLQKASVHDSAHTNTIGVQADNSVINGEDFISENTPLTINNDPLVVPL